MRRVWRSFCREDLWLMTKGKYHDDDTAHPSHRPALKLFITLVVVVTSFFFDFKRWRRFLTFLSLLLNKKQFDIWLMHWKKTVVNKCSINSVFLSLSSLSPLMWLQQKMTITHRQTDRHFRQLYSDTYTLRNEEKSKQPTGRKRALSCTVFNSVCI